MRPGWSASCGAGETRGVGASARDNAWPPCGIRTAVMNLFGIWRYSMPGSSRNRLPHGQLAKINDPGWSLFGDSAGGNTSGGGPGATRRCTNSLPYSSGRGRESGPSRGRSCWPSPPNTIPRPRARTRRSPAVPETLAADVAGKPRAYAHSPQRANRSPEPARAGAPLRRRGAGAGMFLQVYLAHDVLRVYGGGMPHSRRVRGGFARDGSVGPDAAAAPRRTGTPPCNVRVSRSHPPTRRPVGACRKRALGAIARKGTPPGGSASTVWAGLRSRSELFGSTPRLCEENRPR